MAGYLEPLSNIKDICSCIGYYFKDQDLLSSALKHTAYGKKESSCIFERLEFLGDRVFNLSLAHTLYRNFSSENEGDLAVRQAYFSSSDFMIDLANYIGLTDFLDIPHNYETGSLSKSALADTVEALIGAVYLDGGYEAAFCIVNNWLKEHISRPVDDLKDSKSVLQEWSQHRKMGLPLYKVIKREGLDHSPVFTVQVFVGQEGLSALGMGGSKREAEQHAAAALIKDLDL